MRLSVTTAASSYPVTLSDLKSHLVYDTNDFDATLTGYLSSATDMMEGYLERSLVTQTVTMKLRKFPTKILLPRGPVTSVTSVKYYDDSNNEQTVSSSNYIVGTDNQLGIVEPIENYTWPSTYDREDAVEVIYVAGYGAASAVPDLIKTGIKAICGVLDQNRGDSKVTFDFALRLANKYKVYQSAWGQDGNR